ncbi:MAG: cysteine desulfurase NifS [Oscillospiraceae bacterium]|nr:cysteine desulfurase NifS [Oscillospiraceae bacterium]
MQRFIYADNAATTKISKPVLDAMMPYLTEEYGNPSSIYAIGRKSKRIIEDAREKVAELLGAEPREIFFTSSGTESDNWALRGAAEALKAKGKTHIITSAIEHHAVLHTVKALEKEGFTATYLPVNSEGFVSVSDIENAITDKTAIVSIMFANNEIGTIQPIKEIGEICRKKGVYFHTDAVQAVTHVPINVKELNVDMLSLSAHKFHGPKGVGIFYLRKGVRINNLLYGGGQENSRRPSTENTAYIVGAAKALELGISEMEKREAHLKKMRNRLWEGLKDIPRCRLNGSLENRVSGNLNVSFEGVEGEAILLSLDFKGIAASSGSACTSGSLDPSHVLLAIGLPHEIAHGSVRYSFSEDITEEDIDYIIEATKEVISKLRAMSPVWEKIKNEE